jgi:hypothetical protein
MGPDEAGNGFIIFGDPLKPSIWGFLFTFIFMLFSWLFSTKIKWYQQIRWKTTYFLIVIIGTVFSYLWLVTTPIQRSVTSYLYERLKTIDQETIGYFVIFLDNPEQLMTLIKTIPLIIVLTVLLWMINVWLKDKEAFKEVFEEFKFNSKFFQRFVLAETQSQLPDVIVGPNSETGELVIMPGKDRTLNSIIVGSIGTGKTAALVLPMVNQDLHHMVKFINDFEDISNREDFETEEVQGSYLNGITIIEPSNDLCKKAYALVRAHGIPSESVYYIDPTNPDTPSINPMQGPAEKVAEAFTMVIEGLAENGNSNFFFQQSERNHLKHYIYLLKLHDENYEATFADLIDMYNNPMEVRQMHVKLKERIPEDIDAIEERDERNTWKIIKGIDEWFDMNHQPSYDFKGNPIIIKEGKYRGQQQFHDARAEHVVGLRNVLNDIASNILLRRVLFGKSTFDFDKHLKYGGVLLLNSAKGELGLLSNILGKLILLSIQNAVFRREPNISTYHSIYVDEFPDYVFQPFKEFPAQSRKYKANVHVVCQTIAQLADKYGDKYMNTLLTTLRNKFVYADVSEYDARTFSSIFGEKNGYEESTSEQSVPSSQENPTSRIGSSFSRKKQPIMSPADILSLDAYECAVKLVENNKSMPARKVRANFVPKEEFKEAIVQVDEESARKWLEERNRMLNEQPKMEILTEELERDEEPISQDGQEQGQKAAQREEYQLPNIEVRNEPTQEYQVDFNRRSQRFRAHKKEESTEALLFSSELLVEPSLEEEGTLTDYKEDNIIEDPEWTINEQDESNKAEASESKESFSNDEVADGLQFIKSIPVAAAVEDRKAQSQSQPSQKRAEQSKLDSKHEEFIKGLFELVDEGEQPPES